MDTRGHALEAIFLLLSITGPIRPVVAPLLSGPLNERLARPSAKDGAENAVRLCTREKRMTARGSVDLE
jgi:hypothetical protein